MYKFEPYVAIDAEVVVPLSDGRYMPQEAWEDIPAAAKAADYRGRIGVLALVSTEREQTGTGSRNASLVVTDDAIHTQDDRWTAFPINLPADLLAAEFTSSDARVGHDATIRIETSAHRGDLRPIQTIALLSTNVERLVVFHNFIKGAVVRRLPDDISRDIAGQLRKPEAERGEYRLLLRTFIRTDISRKSMTLKLKHFAIEWPQATDGSDVRLSVATPQLVGGEVFTREQYEEHRLSYNSNSGQVEVGEIDVPLIPPDPTSGSDGTPSFEVILRFANPELLTEVKNLKAEMALEFEGSILGVRPVFSDWNSNIIAGNGATAKVTVSQTTEAKIQMTINTQQIFENQYFAFGYRLRLRGVVIDAGRLQDVKQVLAERNMTLRAEGLDKEPEHGSPVGRGQWLLMADRPVRGDNLLLTSLIHCETRQVALIEGTEAYRRQSQAIGADTTIDILGILRGKREDLMQEVNAYARELRRKLGIYATLR